MERENIIEKIRALRALSQCKSTTLEEAATAARMAELLIQKHALAEAELQTSEPSKEDIIDADEPLTDWDRNQVVWQNILIHGLAKAYNCTSVFRWNKGKPGIYAVGRPSDIEVLRYQYTFFLVELYRLAHMLAPSNLKRGSGKTWHNSFYRGAVHAILESLESAKKEVHAQATSSALQVINQRMQEVLDYRKQKFPTASVKKFGGRVDLNAYQAGIKAGSNLNPKPGLGPGVRGLLK